ncbi:cilia- and flagella-associated protein 299 isoform X1 [Pseudochaenichthys georgianus]|uniref:cilia- and flagella-associated protein 299 isoform X1 n=1 Tax=Pseudochaenichthys georgianus TaxID=52239 RepID=UPI0014699DFE|nr:cilia- and flagella-associated protein 299 isoform X1 [Pseudochaenichthys georgianus]
MEYSTAARVNDSVTQFKVYEDYLDSKVKPMDLFYLKSRELARKLVKHGHKGTVLSREEFEEKKAAAQAAQAAKSNTFYSRSRPMTLASAGKELKDNFLKALAEREEANRSGKMTSVIFIRDHNTLGQEVSGYIDYAHRLKTQDFEPYFSGKMRLMPGRSDLCHKEHRAATPAPALASTSHLQQGRVDRFTYADCNEGGKEQLESISLEQTTTTGRHGCPRPTLALTLRSFMTTQTAFSSRTRGTKRS